MTDIDLLDYDLQKMIENCIDEALVSPPRSRERRQAIRAIVKLTGRSESTVYRCVFKYALAEAWSALLGPPHRKRRVDVGISRKFPAELQEKVKEILSTIPRMKITGLRELLDNRVSLDALKRWVSHNYDRFNGHWLPLNRNS